MLKEGYEEYTSPFLDSSGDYLQVYISRPVTPPDGWDIVRVSDEGFVLNEFLMCGREDLTARVMERLDKHGARFEGDEIAVYALLEDKDHAIAEVLSVMRYAQGLLEEAAETAKGEKP
jgi:hypothetical protein